MPLNPSIALQYLSAAYSHVGMVRQINEDAFLEAMGQGLWVVADGMGGHAAGDYVSHLLVDYLRAVPKPEGLDAYVQHLEACVQQVNARVREETLARGGALMGSTLVMLVAEQDRAVCLWAGDSRLYRLRDGRLLALSHDHSYVQELVDNQLLNEEEARHHPMGNIVTRAVGVDDQLALSQHAFEVRPGDSFLLCSDGLTGTVKPDELAEVLHHVDPYDVVRSLVHLGLTRGAPDNITAIVVKVL